MGTVKLNHEGIDILEMRLSATGTNEIHFTSKDRVLNSSLDYVFGISDLNVDCSSLPIFPPTANDILITIQKRHAGFANADHSPTFGIEQAGQKFFDTATFMAKLSTWANTFSRLTDGAGVDQATHGGGASIAQNSQEPQGLKYLKIGFDAGGRLKFTGISHFWNHFVLSFSEYAVKLFQLQDVVDGDRRLSLTRDAATGVISTQALLTAPNPAPNPANILNSNVIIGRGSILKHLDHRLFITVETHLPTTRNLKVTSGKEESDRSLVRVAFDNKATSTIYSESGTIADHVELTTRGYVGRVNFQSKLEPIRQWNTLTSSFEQRIFRFQVFCIYNVFANNVFTQTKTAVPFDEFGEWDLIVRFVNKI